MPLSDLPLAELVDFRPEIEEPEDFDAFWSGTLAEARAFPHGVTLTALPAPITELVVEDLTFSGFGGDPIKGWVVRPAGGGARPAIVEFVGYNGGRGLPSEHWRGRRPASSTSSWTPVARAAAGVAAAAPRTPTAPEPRSRAS